MLCKLFTFLMALTLTPFVFGQTGGQGILTDKIPVTELHGGIELSPRVVRAIALRIAENDDSNSLQVLFSYSQAITTPSYSKEGRLTPEYIRETALAVQRAFQQLQRQYRVPEQQIHILGLSDFAEQNLDELRNEISEKTGKQSRFINSETEMELSVAGTVPRRYRTGQKLFDNRSVSMLLDVGANNIRGSYQQLTPRTQGSPEYEFVTWSIPKGSTTLASDISRAVGESADIAAYAKSAQAFGPPFIRILLQPEISRKPALLGRKRIYLTGGIVWAMMMLLHPEDQTNYTTVTMDDINMFYNRAIADPESLMNPDLSKITNEANRNEIRKVRDQVKQLYSPKSLIAGATLLRLVATELQFQNRTIIYPRYAWLARLLTYIRLRQESALELE